MSLRRPPPRLRPGELSAQDATALNELLDRVSAFLDGGFSAAPPLAATQDYAGRVALTLDQSIQSGITINYANDTISYNSDSITYTSDTITSGGDNSISFISSDTITYNGSTVVLEGNTTWDIQDGTTWNIQGPGFVALEAGLAVESWLTWSCTEVSLGSGTTNNWVPSPATGGITGATNTSPIVLTVPGWNEQPQAGDLIWVVGVLGNTAANGLWRVQVSTATTVTLAGSAGNGAYTAGGTVLTTKTVLNVISSATSTLTGMVPAAFGDPVNAGDITGATNATPIVLTIAGGWTTQPQVGQAVMISGVLGNTAANGIWTVQAVTATTVTLQNSTGNGAFSASPGSWVQLAQPQLVVLNYLGSASLTLSNLNVGSDPANRFLLPPTYGNSVTLEQGDSCILWWDACTNFCWRMISCTVDEDVDFGWQSTYLTLPAGTTNNWARNLATGAVSGATNTSPIVLTVPGWITQPAVGDRIYVNNINGNTAANGFWTVAASTGTTVTLEDSAGNGAFSLSGASYILTTKTVLDLNGAGNTLTGILSLSKATGINQVEYLVLNNVGAGTLVLDGQNGGSDPENQIILPPTYGSSVTLAPNDSITLWWDLSNASCWRVLDCTVGGGGSGTVTSVALAVPAGWGVTGSPITTSGTITLTSPLTTKGDVYCFSTQDARLAVGSNGQVLTADSTQATGLKWATPSTATGTLGAFPQWFAATVNYTDIKGLTNPITVTLQANLPAKAVLHAIGRTITTGFSGGGTTVTASIGYSNGLSGGSNTSFYQASTGMGTADTRPVFGGGNLPDSENNANWNITATFSGSSGLSGLTQGSVTFELLLSLLQ